MQNWHLLRAHGRAALAAFWLALALPATTQAEEATEYTLKAVLYYRLSQFVYWPADKPAPKPMSLCVVGKNPFGNALAQLNLSSGSAEIQLAPADIAACQMIFIPRSEAANLASWLERAAPRQLVTVSDIPGFARSGGMIELPLEGERVGIVINRRTAQKKGFEFNAQLLRLARVIEP
ncbi:YfiR family protein [Dechloromonas sp. A34]|uniref:YfiR family protein n=1 Tax=Dechloromonas sp. A34 TaxID=447588 RepID=UPI00224933B5|nr:YfiR family protein [Dechloromonas sp. A34]